VLFDTDKGYSGETTAWSLSTVGLVSLFGRLIVGYLLDRLPAPFVTATILLLAAFGLVLLIVGTSVSMVCLGAVLVGLAMGAEADLLTFLVSRYFRLVEISRVIAINWVAWALGGALGAPLAAGSFARFGSYIPAYGLFAIVLVLGAIIVCRLGPYINPVHRQRSVGTPEPVASY